MYPAEIVNPMKADLVDAGFSELLDAAAVDSALAEDGTSNTCPQRASCSTQVVLALFTGLGPSFALVGNF